MSRTWDFLSIDKPDEFPCTKVIVCESSVTGISAREKLEHNDEWNLVIGPTFLGVSIIKRRLTLAEDQNPNLDFHYTKAGEVDFKGRKIYLLLESK